MTKEYTSLGLMSGTCGDGVDASIILSDGENKYRSILDRYYKYNSNIYENIHTLKQQINGSNDIEKLKRKVNQLERDITLFHAEVFKDISKNHNIDFIGFHGQTIFHSAKEKISRQLGDGNLLSQLTNKKVIYNFRNNDLKNGGQGAPLTPIFHKLLKNKHNIQLPLIILNIGGIANITSINLDNKIYSCDIGPGNCLIDLWLRSNSNKKYDKNGLLAKSGKVNKIILDQALDNFESFESLKSYDINDFEISFVRGLSLEDGAATLTEYTACILSEKIKNLFENLPINILVCGGGRRNDFLINSVEKKVKVPIKSIDTFGINGDFIESQAFGYISIRSYLNLPITFPETTGCNKPCSGGIIIEPK